jgi:acetyl-CoA C-acetyltransferase
MYSGLARQQSDVVIVSAVRTPVGSFRGALSSLSAVDLGGLVIQEAVKQAKISPSDVEQVIMGNVLSANIGQAPARQACLKAGLPESTICLTVNKVCASGLKAVDLAAQSIRLGIHDIVVCGGMESMSNVPYYLAGGIARNGMSLGNQTIIDGLLTDGLIDPKYQCHMGDCGEETALKYNISRQDQDQYAIQSYKRAQEAYKIQAFQKEIVPVSIPGKKPGQQPTIISQDEEYTKIDIEKIPTLRPAFKKTADGTITAANASKLNDGASALLLMSASKAKELNIAPLARIRSFADSECHPKEFTISPSQAIPIAIKRANIQIQDISLFELNEAFSVVALANQKILNLDPKKVNIYGGAVALGHPLGSSGSRILVTLVHALKNGQLGCAAICNGGGGATAAIVEKCLDWPQNL